MFSRRNVVIACLTAAVVNAAPVRADEQQNNSDTTNDNLSPLTVSATRSEIELGKTPQKVMVISREQIEQQLAITTDRGQILSNLIPSYSPSRQKLTNSGETFRGRDPLFLVDGVPQSNPLRNSARDSYTIDLSMVERIEVIYGASAEHGLGASGGIINFVTKRPEAGAINHLAGASLTIGDNFHGDGLGHKLSYQLSGQQGAWDYLAAASQQGRGVFYDANGQQIGIDGTQGEIQDSSSYDLFLKAGYWFDDKQNVNFSINHFELDNDGDLVAVSGDRDAGIPTTAREGDFEGDAPYNRSTTARAAYSHADWFGNELDAKVYYQRFRALFGGGTFGSFQDASIAPVGTLFDQSRNESDKLGAKFTLRRDGFLHERFDLTTGLDLLQDETQQVLVQTDRAYVPETQYRNAALFVQGDYDLTDALTLHAGVRQEFAQLNVDTYRTIASKGNTLVEGGDPNFDETLFNIGAVFQATQRIQFFANYSEAFSMPDVGRVLRGIDTPGLSVDTALDLQPIITDNREIGTRINWHPVTFELSYFESESDLGQRLSEVGGVFEVNREKKEVQGVEVSGTLQVNDQHRLNAAYSHVEGETDTDGDGQVDTELSGVNVAPDHLILGWNARWTGKLTSFVQFHHYFSRHFEDPALAFDGYSLLNATLMQQLPVGSLSLGIENLLDKDYFTYFSQSGRISDDQYFKGRGRTLTLGYQVSF